MGDFKNDIISKATWWQDEPEDVELAFFTFLSVRYADEYGAFTTTGDTNDAAFAKYLFGEGTKKKPGFIVETTSETKRVVDKIEVHAPAAHKDQQRIRKMTAYLDFLDRYADMVVSRGNLVIRREMIQSVFAGTWRPEVDNSVPAPASQQANLYGGKHFGTNAGVGSYAPFTESLFQVKSIEDKAVVHGLVVPGASIFRFENEIGYDGIAASCELNTRAIRVDSIGSGGQHSHPFPENNFGIASFEKYVIEAIVLAAMDDDIDRLVEIGKFLTVIGAVEREFRPKKQHIAKVSVPRGVAQADVSVPDCLFW